MRIFLTFTDGQQRYPNCLHYRCMDHFSVGFQNGSKIVVSSMSSSSTLTPWETRSFPVRVAVDTSLDSFLLCSSTYGRPRPSRFSPLASRSNLFTNVFGRSYQVNTNLASVDHARMDNICLVHLFCVPLRKSTKDLLPPVVPPVQPVVLRFS